MLGKRPLITVLVGLVGLVLALTFWRVQQTAPLSDEQLRDSGVFILPTARELRHFSLLDQSDQPFTPERLTRRWSLVFFGFTHCPDICPTTMSQIGRHWDEVLAALPEGTEMQMVLASVDPERDTPQVMGEYVRAFHPDFVGITGGVGDLYRLAAGLGLPFMPPNSAAHAGHSMQAESGAGHSMSGKPGMDKMEGMDGMGEMAQHAGHADHSGHANHAGADGKDGENYGVEHSGNVALVNPCGHYVGYIRSPVDGSLLPAALASLARRQPECPAR